MDEAHDERIPPDVIDSMACSADFYLPPHSTLKRELHRTALNASNVRATCLTSSPTCALASAVSSSSPCLVSPAAC